MDLEEKIAIFKQVGEEIITEQDLKDLLSTKDTYIAYDGFEPSGRLHLPQAVMRAININRLTSCGVKFRMFVADWHAWANDKLGGDLEKIQTVEKYFIEVWKASGLDMKNVEFYWASDFAKDDEYWKLVMQIARNNTVARIIRCSQIMGREESETLNASQIFYPCMQCADIFWLKADICQLGMDQRKVNVLAREIAPKLGFGKPVAVHHHMLAGLQEPPVINGSAAERAIAGKVSKSEPDTAIFVEDSKEDLKRKLRKAYCPEGITHPNSVLEYFKYIICPKFEIIEVSRPEKFGGDLAIQKYSELERLFTEKKLHPLDLKNTAVY
ncbi:MAG: tyrosine--tRNA ligase [Candidatus Hodarchaeota archaeon]